MSVTRRKFIQMLSLAAGGTALGPLAPAALAKRLKPANLLSFPAKGNITLVHTTDTHAQLVPIFYREPGTNIGVGEDQGQPPHITGRDFLKYYGYRPDTMEAYAYTCDDYVKLAREYGRMGGFAYMATLIKGIRAERPGKVLHIDGGDTVQGSATSLWTKGEDMIAAMNKLGCEVMTGHWEFTYGQERVLELIKKMDFAFVAQNVNDSTWGDPIFKPYVIKQVGGLAVAVIGQAFPYTPIANPRRFIHDWSFGIKDDHMQALVDELRARKVDLVVVISHNGMDVDKKMAQRVKGIDVVLGGHTHDGVPRPVKVGNTLVINSGCYGKFVSRLDLDVKGRRIEDYSFRLIPVMCEMIEPDPEMEKFVERLRAPYKDRLEEVLGHTETMLYRRGNLDGTFDNLICDALIDHYGVEFSLSPGFRWGRTVPAGPITAEDVYSQTAITYPNTYKAMMKGSMIKDVLEDVADNLLNPDPYLQQGGDMVRSRGLEFSIFAEKPMGRRIQGLKVRGKPVEPEKQYSMAGWASMAEQPGPPAYDIVIDYIRREKIINVHHGRPLLTA